MKEKLKFLPLGGLKEVGKNCMLAIYGKDALMIDCGVGFPGNDDFLDDDFFIPDFDIIEDMELNLTGLVITHGHEDHIGAVPYLLRRFDTPVFATEFVAELLKERIARISKYSNITAIPATRKSPFDIGPFKVRMIPVVHSIPEAMALEIQVGDYKFIHTGDFKCESSEKSPFENLKSDDIDILFIDSTNVEHKGFSGREKDIKENVNTLVKKAPGRVIATCFSSNTFRLKTLIEAGIANGRKIALMGRSVQSYAAVAKQLGYLDFSKEILSENKMIERTPDNKLLIIVTGSQAEPRSVMKRMSLDMLKMISIHAGDTILFSSKVIPGNELSIGRMIDVLVEKGAEIHYENTDHIHVSGHAYQDELMLAIKDVNPKLVVPVHGHVRFLDFHARKAEELGYTTRIISDGDIFVCGDSTPYIERKIELEPVIVSNMDSELVDIETVKERKRVAKAGFMSITLNVRPDNETFEVQPIILSSGLASISELKKIEKETKEIIYNYFSDEISYDPDWEDVEEEIRIRVRRFLKNKTAKKPVVYSTIIVND